MPKSLRILVSLFLAICLLFYVPTSLAAKSKVTKVKTSSNQTSATKAKPSVSLPSSPPPQGYNPEEIKKAIDSLINIMTNDGVSASVMAISLKDNTIVYEYNSDKKLIPASVTKLFTTAAALHYLGPDYTYTTILYRRGEIMADGTLSGDLILRGTGDPTLSSRFSISAANLFGGMAAAVKNMGITAINGDIICDDSYFGARDGASGNTNYCGLILNALSFNRSYIDVVVRPGKQYKAPAIVSFDPPLNCLTISNHAVTGSSRSRTQLDINNGGDSISINGLICSRRREYRKHISVSSPALLAGGALKTALMSAGIKINGAVRYAPQPINSSNGDITVEEVTTLHSPPLSYILKTTNKYSNNFYAEQLLRTIGATVKGEGTVTKGIEAVKDFLAQLDIKAWDIFLADGSGLSRSNVVGAKQVVKLLQYMHGHQYFSCFLDSLSIAGMDGTLRRRYIQTSGNNNLYGKTGTLNQVKSLAGYVNTKDGEPLAFCILLNNTSSKWYSATVKIGEMLANSLRN
jgi:D-alanyl-D-alanine carboxypeptidase/D-alanyl-D-alanine-endopeptidase (penicillin-binding protein 4)